MGSSMQTPETRADLKKLAAEYKVAIFRYYDEVDVKSRYSAPVGNRLDTMLVKVKNLQPGGTKLFVVHIGLDDPEMSAMEDLNPHRRNKRRYAELKTMSLPATARAPPATRSTVSLIIVYLMKKKSRQ